MRSFTCVFTKFGTYQSRPMSLWSLTNCSSFLVSSLVSCTVGFFVLLVISWCWVWSETILGSVGILCCPASSSTWWALVMALVLTPTCLSVMLTCSPVGHLLVLVSVYWTCYFSLCVSYLEKECSWYRDLLLHLLILLVMFLSQHAGVKCILFSLPVFCFSLSPFYS